MNEAETRAKHVEPALRVVDLGAVVRGRAPADPLAGQLSGFARASNGADL
jgi:hypothetical protein